jgi:TRAP-type C4-dicarboxylate transport system permease large subunit
MSPLGVPRAVSVTVTVLGLATVVWALYALFDHPLPGILAGLATVAFSWWRSSRETRPDRDQGARLLLGRRAADVWGAPVVATLLALACVVVALVRDEAAAALPAVPLVLWAVVVALLIRRALQLAEERLADLDAA